MRPRFSIPLAIILALAAPDQLSARPRYPCLPASLKPADIVSAEHMQGDRRRLVTVTVKDTLKQLRARCVKNKLVDRKGREVRFYQTHCFGAPTAYAIETTRRERAELEALRKMYTVIVMTSNPSGDPCA